VNRLFRQVSVKDRLPEKEDRYFTDCGELGFDSIGISWYDNDDYSQYPSLWLEPVELPKEVEVKVATFKFGALHYNETPSKSFQAGANYILDTLKATDTLGKEVNREQ
jgi:hypothetical protein